MSAISRLLSRAIWKAHGQKCIYCDNFFEDPSLQTIDHVIPFGLDWEHKAQLFTQLDLPEDYDLNALDNLLPAHSNCNGRKSDNERSLKFYYFFRGIAADKKESVEEHLRILKRLEKEGDHRSFVAELIAGNEQKAEQLVGLCLSDGLDFAEGRQDGDDSIVISRSRVKLDCFLPSPKRFEGSALLTLRPLRLRGVMITFDHEMLCKYLWKGLDQKKREERGFFFGVDPGTHKIGVSLGNTTLFLSEQEYGQLCEVVDEVGEVYLKAAYEIERKWGTLSTDYLGSDHFIIGKVPQFIWRALLHFARTHDVEGEKTKWHRFEGGSGVFKIAEWNAKRTKWSYVAILYGRQPPEFAASGHPDRIEIIWRASTHASNALNSRSLWRADQVQNFFYDSLIPKIIEEYDPPSGMLARFLGKQHHPITIAEAFQTGRETRSLLFESNFQDKGSAQIVLELLQYYFNARPHQIFHPSTALWALDALDLVVQKAAIPQPGLDYIAQKIDAEPVFQKIRESISASRTRFSSGESEVNGFTLDLFLRGIITAFDHEQLESQFFPVLFDMLDEIRKLIRDEVYRERLVAKDRMDERFSIPTASIFSSRT